MNLLFVTDIHGSEKCYRKFLNAQKKYPIDCLILGGDLSGKGLVPIIKNHHNNYKATLLGEDYSISSSSEMESLEKHIRFNGFYPYRTDDEGVNRLTLDPTWRNSIFTKLIVEQMERWENLANEYLNQLNLPLYIIPGNDDIYEIDDILNNSTVLINVDNKIVELPNDWFLIGAGYSNHTPWHGPREFDEEVIFKNISDLAVKIPKFAKTIFNFHCPPFDSYIDSVQLVDEEFRPRFQGINPMLGHGGSTAIRKAYDLYSPKLGLHGHIHESKGVSHIRGAIAVNPGSDYSTGIMKGVIISLSKTKVESHIFIEG